MACRKFAYAHKANANCVRNAEMEIIMGRHGENIRKRIDGRWEGRYKVYDEIRKKNMYRSVYGHTYHEVKDKLTTQKNLLQKYECRMYSGKDSGGSLLFSQAAKEWLEEVREKRKYSTYIKYELIYRKHLSDFLGSCRITEISAICQASERWSSLSVSLQKSICCVLNQILRYAARHYHICVEKVERAFIKTEKKPIETFSKPEQAKLFSNLYKDMDLYITAVLLCMYTGLRLGELCALRWTDLDEKNITISVNHTVQRIATENQRKKSALMESAPKSGTSKRTIPVSEEMMDLLRGLQNRQLYVFGGMKPLEPRTMQYRFKQILKEAGIERRNFHILRHTFATNCMENCMDIKSLSEILGHSDVKITLNCYVHPTLEAKREQIGRLPGFYGQICGRAA